MAIPKKGDTVRQIMPEPVVGVVADYVVCQETGIVSLKVVTTRDDDGDGVMDERYFTVDQVEKVG
jgi:hypothetical protein